MSISTASFKSLLLSGMLAASFGVYPAFGQSPVILAAPSSLIFNYTIGGTVPASQSVIVSSSLAATINIGSPSYTTAQNGWLTSIPTGGTSQAAPVSLNLFVNPVALPAGNYSAQIQLGSTPAADPSSTLTITVFLVVAASGSGGGASETITASPTSLSFSYQSGGAVPLAQTVTVSTSDNASVTVLTQTNDGNPWLVASSATLTTPGGVNISVNPAGLAASTYMGTITLTAPNSVTQVAVTFTVGGTALMVSPSTLSFNVPQNYGFSAPQTLQVTSSMPVTLMAFGNSDLNWLVVDPPTASTPAVFSVKVNDSSLAQGTYQGMVTAQAGPNNSVQVPVTLTVGPPAVLQLQPGSLTFTYQTGGLSATVPSQTVKVNSITSTAAQPFTIAFTTNDGARWLNATASPSTTPGVVTVSVNPAGLAPGSYSGTINVNASIPNSSPQPILISLTVLPVPPPVVSAVTNAASYAGGTVAPGEIVAIFGTGLGPNMIAIPPAGPAPTTLANTLVTFDGLPAPIIYTFATQTSVQIPYGINIGQTVMRYVSTGGSTAGIPLNSVPAFPGLFTTNSSGKGQAAALNQNLSVNSAANPATRGGALVLYATGEGKTNPPEVEGSITPVVAPFPMVSGVAVTIGGQLATISYAGETPGVISGLLQVNVTIPAAAPTGAAVPVQVFVNGQPSQGNVTVAIQ